MPKKRVIRVATQPLKINKAVKSYVKKAIGRAIETKVEERVNNDETFSFASSISRNLTAIGAGDDQNQRSGNKVKVVRIRGRAYVHCTGTVDPFPVRMVIVQDKENTGTLPTITDVFPNMLITSVASQMQGMDTEAKSELKERFTILYDKTKLMNNIAGAESSNSHKLFQFNKKLNITTYFNGTADTDESKNAIVMFLVPGSDDADIKCDGVYRTYFKDA